MTDIFSPEQRSSIMSKVKGAGNKSTELRLMALFRLSRVSGWRRNTSVFGKPDFVFPKARVAVFVDGCFWHSCPLHGTTPVQNKEFWAAKLGRNRMRDFAVTAELKRKGWKVLRIWQHELRVPGKVIARTRRALGHQAY